MADSLQIKNYSNPDRVNVTGVLELDGVQWQVSAWV